MTTSTLYRLLLALWGILCLTPAHAQRLAAGAYHALSIHPDGTLWAWGANSNGQLGIGSTAPQTTPTPVGTATTWVSVSAGQGHTVALRQDGTLWAWGRNDTGQLGLGTGSAAQQATPVPVGTATSWVSVSAGGSHTLAVRADGTLWAWGANNNGQLGDGSTTDRPAPVQVGTATTWQSVSAGLAHTVALRRDGTLWAWGSNNSGQLGLGTGGYQSLPQLTPAQVGTATDWASVSAGFDYTLAVRTTGTLWAWGSNGYGQLGTGLTTANTLQPTPVQVGTGTTWRSVATGQFHTVAVRQDGTLWAWGSNQYGQLGLGTADNYQYQYTPAQVGTATTWQSVAAGYAYSLALRTNNDLYSWGASGAGVLGNGVGFYLTPRQVGTASWQALSTGTQSSLGIRIDGTLWAWGGNFAGQLGLGTTNSQYTPTQVGTATTWRQVEAGNIHALAIRQDGTLWGWGANYSGQLGLGTSTYSEPIPTQVGTATWASVSAGEVHTLGIRTDGTLWAWGANYAAQLGLGLGSTPDWYTPTQVGTATWRSVSAGASHTLAIRADGTLWAWGSNIYGQLGTGTGSSIQQSSPVQLGAATTWVSVSASLNYSLAVRADGTLWAWGNNDSNQLGLGTGITTQFSPVQVGTATTWKSTSPGIFHSLGLRADGSLWAWGQNYAGQLGLGTTDPPATPAQVGTQRWQAVAGGDTHSLGLAANGTLWAWGNNDTGQLGLGSPNYPLPLLIPNGGRTLATASTSAASAWSLAPNPAHGRVQLTGLPAGPLTVRLFDAQGRLVRAAATSSIGLEGLAPGLYLLQATAGPTSRTLRLVVE